MLRITSILTVAAVVVMLIATPAFSAEPLTTAEKSDYTRTSLYPEIMEFLHQVARGSGQVRIATMCQSTEGRDIPLVVISSEGIATPCELRMTGKPCVLIQANIHAGEVEGKEACLMLIRDIAAGKTEGLLTNQAILVIPDLNADGNEKLSQENRRDNGPPLAGTRANGQNLDLNRDYPKLDSPEITALVDLLNRWDPVLMMDMHTKNGSYHRAPVTYTTVINPNSHPLIRDYMWEELFPRVKRTMKEEFGYLAMPYGNFKNRLDPREGWRNHAVAARYGSNYVGLRNRFTILDENYPYADFRTRVLSSYSFIRSVLRFTNRNIGEMEKVIRLADRETAEQFHRGDFALEHRMEELFDLTVKSYRFINQKIPPEEMDRYPPWFDGYLVKKTDQEKDYRVPYIARAVPARTVEIPEGYIILPSQSEIASLLRKHGITVERINNRIDTAVEKYAISQVELSDRLYQGHVHVEVTGEYQTEEVTIPEGAYYISMKQPLARVAAFLLEPESDDSLLRWGFFNKILVKQWGRNRPNLYPVYRADGIEDQLELALPTPQR